MHRISSQVSLPQPSHRVRIRGDLIRARCRITLPPHRNEASARDKKRQKDRDSEHKLRRKFHNQQRIAWLIQRGRAQVTQKNRVSLLLDRTTFQNLFRKLRHASDFHLKQKS